MKKVKSQKKCKQTHFVKSLASLIVSGNFVLRVSGRSRQRSHAETEQPPNITNGKACPNLPPTTSPYNIKQTVYA